jgi:hypothetical protein
MSNQFTTALTAADLPKGTRVASPEGRMGTVNGVDVGRVTLSDHPSYGREYVGVDWDADTKCPWGGRSRPFVDELAIEDAQESATTETFVPVDFADVHEGDTVQFVTANNGFDGGDDVWRIGTVTKVTEKTVRVACDSNAFGSAAVLRKHQPSWNARCVSKSVETPDEAPFQPGERVVHADGRCFKFVSVNPEDSSRILVARPTDGRVVSWILSECRAENETEIAARHGETDKLHNATCKSQGDCISHGIKDKRGSRGLELGVIPACEPGTTYGAWSEGAGGFVHSGDCATEVANWAADELRKLVKEDDTDTIEILAVCRDHEEQPKGGCEGCAEEDPDDE